MFLTKKNKEGCYCAGSPDLGENSEMMTVCFNCGVVLCDKFIDTGDETNKYQDTIETSRCNGYTKTSYMSHQNNLTMSFKNMRVSSYSQNFIKWSAFTADDLIILKTKDFLERKSHDYSMKQAHITVILNKYKKLLELKKNNKDFNFKGKYTKGILAVFTYIAMKPIKKETVCEIFEITDDFALFNKCCKLYKDIFKEDVNHVVKDKNQILSEIMEIYEIPYKVKDLIEKGYSICLQFNVFDNMYSKKNILVIMMFFLKELEYDMEEIEEDNKTFTNSKIYAQMMRKLDVIKYQIFNEIKKVK